MASAATTPNLGLPQWVATEKPERTDFNAALLAIDGAIVRKTGDTMTGNLGLGDKNIIGNTANIDDDSVISFTPGGIHGVILIFGTTSTTKGYFALVGYRAYATGVYTQAIVVGADVNCSTGAFTGTTGTDTKITVSAHTDGKIYIENRTGASVKLEWVLFGD